MKKYDEHMKKCPKCGSCEINGPKYLPSAGFDIEHLIWRCDRCGYIQETRTMDDVS